MRSQTLPTSIQTIRQTWKKQAMRSHLKCVVIGLLGLSALCSHAENSDDQIQIMETGQYHGDEITARFGIAKAWLALIVNNQQAELAPSTPKISKVFDPVSDEEGAKSSYSGKLVEVHQHDPILLIKASWLKPGPIAQAKLTDDSQAFTWDERQFRLLHRCGKASSKESLLECQVVFSDGKNQQFIIDTSEPNQGYSDEFASTVNIVWAGDIDRDGKPDFILLNTHYNGENTQLFLSSKANKNQLVKSAARVYRVGC